MTNANRLSRWVACVLVFGMSAPWLTAEVSSPILIRLEPFIPAVAIPKPSDWLQVSFYCTIEYLGDEPVTVALPRGYGMFPHAYELRVDHQIAALWSGDLFDTPTLDDADRVTLRKGEQHKSLF